MLRIHHSKCTEWKQTSYMVLYILFIWIRDFIFLYFFVDIPLFYHNTLLCRQAGGNWGDLYPTIQKPRMSSFPLLLKANFTVIGIVSNIKKRRWILWLSGLPQSLHYKNKNNLYDDAKELKKSLVDSVGDKNIMICSFSQLLNRTGKG